MNYVNTFNTKQKHNRASHSQRTAQQIFVNVGSPVSLNEILLKH